jgi:putative lumazine-binding protein
MKRLTLAFALGMGLLTLLNLSANAQEKDKSTNDVSAVRATVTNYIEAYYTADAHRMEQTLHPHYLKHMIHGDIRMREWNGAQMVESVRANNAASLPVAERTEEVSVLDVAGNLASAKLVTPGWTDYLTLLKVDGEWKILSVVQRIED